MTATIDKTEISRYVEAVRVHLGALPEGERRELLEDLEHHLREVAAEDGVPLVERVGPPAAYAAELLASAGLEPDGATIPDRVVRLASLLRHNAIVDPFTDLSTELRHAWWVLRGATVAFTACVLLSSDFDRRWPVPGAGLASVLLLAGAVALASLVSVRLGRRWQAEGKGNRRVLANLAVLPVGMLGLSLMGGQGERWITPEPVYGLHAPDGHPISNIFPFDGEGRLLQGVLLYDQLGRPIEAHRQAEMNGLVNELPVDANGAPVTNAYPLEQWSPDEYGQPSEPPAVVVPPRPPATATSPPAAAP